MSPIKPKKLRDIPKSYRQISLLSVPFKVLERLILKRIEPLIEGTLAPGQACFQKNCRTEDQTLAETDIIETAFESNQKCGAGFFGSSSAYDTIWPGPD